MPDRVAVVIPCYNHARFVGEALESVLGQTHKPHRIIVIDDGSNDDSLGVLRGFAARGVEVFAQDNRGAHAALNTLVGLAVSDCDWIAILNSDDRYLPNRLEAALEQAYRQPGKSVFSTGLSVIDENGAAMPDDAPRAKWFHKAWSLGAQEGTTLMDWLGQANFVATTSNIFARSSYLKANPFRPYRFNHDYYFLAGAMLDNKLMVMPDVMLEYRVHRNNTIVTRPEPLMREMIRMHLDLYRTRALELTANSDLRQRFYAFTRSSWDNISSFHAGLFQVALAQLARKCSEDEIAVLAARLEGGEFEEFPNQRLAAAPNGSASMSVAGNLGRQVEELNAETEQLKIDRDALDRLSRYRHKMLRSPWVRLGLMTGMCYDLVSNRGKKPHEKMLWLRDACTASLWLKLGEKLGSRACYDLRRGAV